MLTMSDKSRSGPAAELELSDLFFNSGINNINSFSSPNTIVGSTTSSASADHPNTSFFSFNDQDTKDAFLFYDSAALGLGFLEDDQEMFFDHHQQQQNQQNLGFGTNFTELDFTTFLERLDSTTDKQMMQLIAKYFHDRISVFREDKKVFNILDDVYSYSPQNFKNDDLSENLAYGCTRVLCSVDLANSHRAIRDFLSDADELLGDRDDLKMALRGVFPPTFAPAAASDPIFSSPLARKRRRAAKNNSISATISALYGPHSEDDYDSVSVVNRRAVKRGRPRKNTLMESKQINFNSEEKLKPKKEIKQKKKEATVTTDAEDWKPEVKKKKNNGKKESSDKKATKVKAPTDKAKEEADLMAMGLEALEKHILTLQQQMRNVKHKHRKGTICPRCTTEQRLKLAFKAKTKAQNELKAKQTQPQEQKPTNPTPTVPTQTNEAEEKAEDQNEVVADGGEETKEEQTEEVVEAQN